MKEMKTIEPATAAPTREEDCRSNGRRGALRGREEKPRAQTELDSNVVHIHDAIVRVLRGL
ncbi:hypothetical protein [Oricola thermophila]|uniref:Uncharacterized protein n=1 Tax=Oricola thermophila TaxID=2742145 RepID=A0A6N1VA67_9HYPH|nr:hypothetical protein [Oricola thermophila]QKV17836.1 hypothetical protein HTY61_04870 [Oricola thermophila]